MINLDEIFLYVTIPITKKYDYMADVYKNMSKGFKDAFQAGLKLCSVLNLNLEVVGSECYLVILKIERVDWFMHYFVTSPGNRELMLCE